MNRVILSLIFACYLSLGLTQIDYPVSCHGDHTHTVKAPGFVPMAPVDTDGLRSDTFDILHYNIAVDITAPPYLHANTVVTAVAKMDDLEQITLDLFKLEVDSIFIDGISCSFIYDEFQIYVNLPEILQTGDEINVHVFYQGLPQRDESGFGGLVYEEGYIYNLGIGLDANPHNFGRGWFPCFDNFKERSTFEIHMTHNSSLNAHAVGTELGIVDNGDGTKTTSYAMDQQITTYQTSISVANYHTMWSTHDAVYGPIDIKLMAKPQDSTAMKGSMGNLPAALDCIESWYGPYVWERVGYVATTRGAMEHPTHIAYPTSSINGDPVSNDRLMAHELTHNWFGNLITLSTERDMWIKEGPAEYGAHLHTECLYGKEEFLEQVKSNHKYVLDRAHLDDGQFRSLSNMPNSHTYGTHTYRKGASVFHNLRGYLGDTLFSQGMRSILENYSYSHLDAQQFQEQITATTGKDMQPFFEDWILNPGFSVFVDDSIQVENVGNGLYESTIFLQQKLFGTDKFHGLTPLSLHLIGFNGEEKMIMIEAEGQYDEVVVESDFDVKRIILNRTNLLNQARTAHEEVIAEAGVKTFDRTDVILDFNEVSVDLNVRVEHILGQPDNHIIDGDFELNQKHYWRISGDFPGEYEFEAQFQYDGKSEYDLDYPLTVVSEDSILLFYREDASEKWEPIDAKLNKFSPFDGAGNLKLENAQPGEYTIGKGIYDVNSLENIDEVAVEVYPNPTSDLVNINLSSNFKGLIRIIDLQGREMHRKQVNAEKYVDFDLTNMTSGQYFIEIKPSQFSNKILRKLVIIK